MPGVPIKMRGASSGAAGVAGYVPKPVAGDQVKYLRGDGTWQTVTSGISQADADARYARLAAVNVFTQNQRITNGNAANIPLRIDLAASQAAAALAIYQSNLTTVAAKIDKDGNLGIGNYTGNVSAPLAVARPYANNNGQLLLADPVSSGDQAIVYMTYYGFSGRLGIFGYGHYASATDGHFYITNELVGYGVKVRDINGDIVTFDATGVTLAAGKTLTIGGKVVMEGAANSGGAGFRQLVVVN